MMVKFDSQQGVAGAGIAVTLTLPSGIKLRYAARLEF
jgi:hypothetical protein